MNIKYNIILFSTLLLRSVVFSQSVETYAGDKRIGIDVMWFKNFKNMKEEKSSFLFFSRNRASTDYTYSSSAFGSTNAISYNLKNGLGFVTVASFLNTGLTPKAGFQCFKAKGNFMFFGWLVTDLKNNPNIDLFGLFRYQPNLNDKIKLFSQIELFPVYNPKYEILNFTQRLRLGVKYQNWVFGPMADFNQLGKTKFVLTYNTGGFIRYDF